MLRPRDAEPRSTGATVSRAHAAPGVGVRPAVPRRRSPCSCWRSSPPRCSALVPPLVVRAILDTAIPDGDRAMITWLAAAAVAAALADARAAGRAALGSSRVGEGLIYDLRRALFAKVQRMPVAFFTRTPTGAHDVAAQQRRRRRPDRRHEHARQRRQQRRRARHDAGRDARPRVAPDAARARRAAAVRHPGPARRAPAAGRSPASRCSTTRR